MGRVAGAEKAPAGQAEGLAVRDRPKPGAEPSAEQAGDCPPGGGRPYFERGRPQQELESREAASLVRAALSTLEREDRELFVRRYYYGQTVARAAEEMGMNLSTAKSRLRRGRERLKEALRKAGYDVEEN